MRIFIRLEDYLKQRTDAALVSSNKPFPAKIKALNDEAASAQSQLATSRAALAMGRAHSLAGIQTADQRLKDVEKQRREYASRQPRAAAQTKAPGDEFSVIVLVVPTELLIELNGITIADNLTATFPFRDAPFVSNAVRSALVEGYLGTVPEEQFSDPGNWQLPLGRQHLMFRGYVDDWDTDHSDADATTQIKARSYEAVLMDGQINALAPVYRIKGSGEPISTYVNRILEQYPSTSGTHGDAFRAVWYGATNEPTLDRRSLQRTLARAKDRNAVTNGQPEPDTDTGGTEAGSYVGTPADSAMPTKQGGAESSVWELITRACEIAGCIAMYDPSLPAVPADEFGRPAFNPVDHLLLRPPQTINEDVDGGITVRGGPVDGFSRQIKDPTTGKTVTSQLRFMVWGHNIKAFKTGRKFGKVKAQAIEVVSYNSDAAPAERRIVVRFPETKTASRIGAKGEGRIDEVANIVVHGVRDREKLLQIAVAKFNEIGQQEQSVRIETDELSSYMDPDASKAAGRLVRVHNDDPDILRLRAGAPVRVTVARQHQRNDGSLVISSLSEIYEKRPGEIARFLREQRDRFRTNMTDEQIDQTATRVAAAISSFKQTDVFYVRAINHKFTADDGYSAEMELISYVEARVGDKNLSPGDRQASGAKKKKPRAGAKTKAEESRDADRKAVQRAVDALSKAGVI